MPWTFKIIPSVTTINLYIGAKISWLWRTCKIVLLYKVVTISSDMMPKQPLNRSQRVQIVLTWRCMGGSTKMSFSLFIKSVLTICHKNETGIADRNQHRNRWLHTGKLSHMSWNASSTLWRLLQVLFIRKLNIQILLNISNSTF